MTKNFIPWIFCGTEKVEGAQTKMSRAKPANFFKFPAILLSQMLNCNSVFDHDKEFIKWRRQSLTLKKCSENWQKWRQKLRGRCASLRQQDLKSVITRNDWKKRQIFQINAKISVKNNRLHPDYATKTKFVYIFESYDIVFFETH